MLATTLILATSSLSFAEEAVDTPQLERRFESNQRIGRIGLGIALSGVAVTSGSAISLALSDSELVTLASVGGLVLGGTGMLAGGGIATGGTLSAASNVRDLGRKVPTYPAVLGVIAMGGSYFLLVGAETGAAVAAPVFLAGLGACGAQLLINERGHDPQVVMYPWADPAHGRIGLAGRF